MTMISKYLPQLNSTCFRTINRIYTNFGIKPKKDIYLLQKTNGADVVEFSTKHEIIMPQDASEYTYVRLGKKSNLSYRNEIFTFFDNQGRILRRYFRLNGLNKECYDYCYDKNQRTVERSIYSLSDMNASNTSAGLLNYVGKWEKESTEKQIIHKFKDLVKKGKQATLFLTRKVKHNPAQPNTEQITFTEYPINLGFEPNRKKMVVSGTITKTADDIELSELTQSDNMKIDLRDEFLKYRFIDPRSDFAIKCITHKFLKDKNLDDMGLFVAPSSRRVPKNALGYFSEWDQEICFSSDVQKGKITGAVKVAAHEVEHAYQYALIGRIGRSKSRYGSHSMQKLGFPSGEENKLAVKYALARDVYPEVSETEDLSKNAKYMYNLLEVDARTAGEEAVEKYMQYRENFKFFEQFYDKLK